MCKSMRKSCSYSSSKPKASPIEFALNRRALQRLRDLFYFTPFFSSNTDFSAVLMQMVEFLCSADLQGGGSWEDEGLHQTSGEHRLLCTCPFMDIHTTNTDLKILREHMLHKSHKMIPRMQ